MKLLIINIVQSCNKDCYYCPTKKWLYPLGFYFPPLPGEDEETALKNRQYINAITNEALLKWIDKWCDPKEWVMRITGGEPGLYKEINTLIPELNKRGYFGIIETNGTLPIPKSDTIKRIAAWHEGQDFPKFYDTILIIKNPNDNWREKVQFCKDNKIDFRTAVFNQAYCGKPTDYNSLLTGESKLTGMCTVLSMGQIIECFPKPPNDESNIFKMTPPVITSCKCGHLFGFEHVMPKEWNELL